MLENDVKDKQGKYEGVYTFQGFSDGMDYWVHAEGEHAIWFNNGWNIGSLIDLGSEIAPIYSLSNTMEKKCPNNEGYVWNWFYGFDGIDSFVATTDVYVKCATEDDFCTYENPCGTNEGDCDTHDECQDGFSCGSNNCPDYLGFDSQFDCCYTPAVGDEHFCTNNNPCAIDEGDCDYNNECQTNLICDTINSCPTHLGFASDVNCCSVSGCKFCQMISCP